MDYNGVQRSKTRRKMASLPQELVNTRREMHVFVHGLDHCLVFCKGHVVTSCARENGNLCTAQRSARDSHAGQEPACADKLVASKTVKPEQVHHNTTERSRSNLFLALAKFQLPVLLLTRPP